MLYILIRYIVSIVLCSLQLYLGWGYAPAVALFCQQDDSGVSDALLSLVTSLGSMSAKAVASGFSNVLDLYYVCGIFDGEGSAFGSITARTGRYRYNIQVRLTVDQNTSRIGLLHLVKRVLGVGTIVQQTPVNSVWRVSTIAGIRQAVSLLLLGCKAKTPQLHVALYLVDNWVSPSTDPVLFLRNCYLVAYLQTLNFCFLWRKHPEAYTR